MVEKLKNLIKRIETRRGSITLFMLWKDVPEINKWTVVISAKWIDKMNQRLAINYWIKALQNTLDSKDLNTISRVSVIKTSDRFVYFLVRALNVSGGAVRFSKNQIGDYLVDDAIIFEAKNVVGTNTSAGLSNRNPAINGSINPNINGSINPNINGSINPAINGSINPNINGSINPNINGSINPAINGSVNPRINGSINPAINGSINPKINGGINPFLNPNFTGLVLYDPSLNRKAYFIEILKEFLIMFDFSNNFIAFCVKANKDIYNVFDSSNNKWIGYLVSNKQNGFNYFSTNAQWLGFVV